MQSFATILQTSLPKWATLLRQIMREPKFQESQEKKTRTYAKRGQPECSKYVDRFVGVFSQHKSDEEGTSVTSHMLKVTNENDSASIQDQKQACQKVAEQKQHQRAGNIQLISSRTHFQMIYVKISKKSKKREST